MLEAASPYAAAYALEMVSAHDTTLFGRAIYVSPACTALLGYTPNDLVGLPAASLFHPDDLTGKVPSSDLKDAMRLHIPKPSPTKISPRADGTRVPTISSCARSPSACS